MKTNKELYLVKYAPSKLNGYKILYLKTTKYNTIIIKTEKEEKEFNPNCNISSGFSADYLVCMLQQNKEIEILKY